MKQPKPMAGQTWRGNRCVHNSEVIIDPSKDGLVHYGQGKHDATTVSHFTTMFTFVPKNDLEWLACNVDNWGSEYPDYSFVSRYFGWSFHKQMATNRYTRKQWQNTRYKLGLDDKPHITAKSYAAMIELDKQAKVIRGVINRMSD
jgi:hypothetical protein